MRSEGREGLIITIFLGLDLSNLVDGKDIKFWFGLGGLGLN